MSDPTIDDALTQAYIAGGFSSTSTEFPNMKFEPVVGKDWNAIHLIPANSSQASFGRAGRDLEQGIFQVTLATPRFKGDGNILARARLLKSYFQQNNKLTNNGTEVSITTITINQSFISGDWYKVPVSINYKAYLTRG